MSLLKSLKKIFKKKEEELIVPNHSSSIDMIGRCNDQTRMLNKSGRQLLDEITKIIKESGGDIDYYIYDEENEIHAIIVLPIPESLKRPIIFTNQDEYHVLVLNDLASAKIKKDKIKKRGREMVSARISAIESASENYREVLRRTIPIESRGSFRKIKKGKQKLKNLKKRKK